MTEVVESSQAESQGFRQGRGYVPQEPNPEQRKSWFKRLLDKKLTKKQAGAEAAVILGGAATVAAAILARGGGKSDSEPVFNPGVDATNTQTVELTPTATIPSGETIIPGTNVVVPNQTSEAQPTATPEITRPQSFVRLESKIKGVTDSAKQKEALADLAKIEAAYSEINQYVKAYEKQVGSDGKPVLYTLVKQQYGQMDLSDYWKDLFPAEKDFLESQIFFLQDKANIDKQLAYFAGSDKSADVATEGILNFFKGSESVMGMYTQEKVKPFTQVTFEIPQSVGADVKARLQQASEQFSVLGKVKVVVAATNPSFENTGGTEQQVGDTDVITLSSTVLGTNPERYAQAYLHEAGHAWMIWAAPERRTELVKYLTPDQVVDLMKMEFSAQNNPDFGRDYPDISKVLRVGRKFSSRTEIGSVNTALEFRESTGLFEDIMWVGQTKEWNSVLQKPVFGADVFPTAMFAKLTADAINHGEQQPQRDKLSPQDQKWLQDHSYNTVEDFLAVEKANLDQLATSNPNWKYVVDKLRENPQKFDGYKWLMGLGFPVAPVPVSGLPSTWYTRGLPTFGNLIFLEEFSKNNADITSRFTVDQKREIERQVISLQGVADQEKFADAMALTANRSIKQLDGKHNPYLDVLDFENSLLK